ncbi:MAG TPA: GxxExxY protein [Verrucomicrobiae bacterium]
MPVILRSPIRHLTQAEFAELAYSVMGCVFQIHQDMGRFFDEKVYKRELAYRHSGVELEVPVEVIHGTFRKVLYLDVLVDGGAPFEFKAVEALTSRHGAQLLHYMLLFGFQHGKLVNVRKETVEHEFVNTTLQSADRTRFTVAHAQWDDSCPGAAQFRQLLTDLLRDLGTGLDLQLYEEAMTHLLGGEVHVLADVMVRTSQHTLGHQKMRLAAPRIAFVMTAQSEISASFETHTRRLLKHMDLDAIFWANISLKTVTFTTVKK